MEAGGYRADEMLREEKREPEAKVGASSGNRTGNSLDETTEANKEKA